ncbi:MAG: sigma-70 family RNA polymerase sigma factor [Cyclobacteriaceae bacterium]
MKANTDIGSVKLLRSYLFSCIRNQAIRMKSNDPYYSENVRDDMFGMEKIDPEELLMGKELDQFLQNTINNLPPQCGLVFRMIKEDSLKYEEVAKELGISVDTVKYHLKIALKTIKSKLEDHFADTKVISWFSSGTIIPIISKFIFYI